MIEVANGDSGKEEFQKGDEVFGLAYGGAYAEFIVVNMKMLLRKPGHLSWVEAAGIPEVGSFSPKRWWRDCECENADDQLDLDYCYPSASPHW